MPDSRKPVLVTGSSGLIGSAVVRSLASEYTMIGFDREGLPHPPAEADNVFVDLRSDESVQNAFTRVRLAHGSKIESVIHLAAYYDFSGTPSPEYERVTVGGTGRLLRELARFDVGQFLFSSTMLVHAPGRPGERITEETPLQPKWAYPASKVQAEELLRRERGSMPVVLLRIAGVYDDLCHSVPLAHQIQRIYEGRLTGLVFPGNPAHGQAFVHLDDVVEAIRLAVRRREGLDPVETMLVGEPETMSYAELQAELGRLIHGKAWPAWPVPRTVAKAGAWIHDRFAEPFIRPWMVDLADDHYALDISRAAVRLGWAPRRSLRETLPAMVRALREDPPGWYRRNKLKAPRRRAKAG
jgi:nucleoside-diphosphate-sugar epimerase